MGGNTFGYRQAETAGTYWRRRFIVLMIGFATFGLAVWALSTALAVSQVSGRTPAPSHHHPGLSAGTDQASQAGGRRAKLRKLRSAPPRLTPQANAAASPSPVPASPVPASPVPASPAKASQAPASTDGQATGHGKILPAFCAKSDIVLSLFTGQTQFGRRQWPAFDVSVVSTQLPDCTFNIGSRHLALVIKEGPAQIWSSADCAAGAGGLDSALKRGVPTELVITWNRRTSAPGCSSRTTKVPPGVYTAYAVEGQLTSQPVIFRLS
jgi:hypothetical protein